MKYRAVIFDLFGTLVPPFSFQDHEQVVVEMAAALRVSLADFNRAWQHGTYQGRTTGRFASLEASVRQALEGLGVEAAAHQVARAVQARLDFTRRALVPKPGAVETLARLRALGLKTGLITDCSVEVPVLWPEGALAPLIDAPVFSCLARATKPDPRLYLGVCARLGVEPRECLYVGDGSGRELTGARQVGMEAVLLRISLADAYDTVRPEVLEWRGPAVEELHEVLDLVGAGG